MNFYTKKILILTMMLALIVPYGAPFLVQNAHAQSPTSSGSTISSAGGVLSCLGGGLLEGILGAGASIVGAVVPVNDSPVTSNTGAVKNKDCVLDGLTTVIREVLISSLTRSVVNWINNGFDGEPAFITDLEGFLLDIGDQVIGKYIEGSELAFLCSPFQIDVRIRLALDYYAETRDRVSCTLTGALENIEDAFDDFSSGSAWDSWFQLSVNPNNNAFGSFIGARQNIRQDIANEQGEQQRILDWGNGIRSYEICDTDGQLDPNNSANVSVGKLNCKIATPGVVINEQLSQVIGSGFRQLELADEINEIIGALLGQLSQQVLGGSSGGFSGLSSSSYSRPAYVDQLTDGSENNSEEEFRDYGVSVVDGSINIENQYISTKNVSLARLSTSENLLNALSQCYIDKLPTTQNPNTVPTLSLDQQAVAIERAATATSTITSNIAPLQALLLSDIEQAQNNISNLLIIKDHLLNASSRLAVERILENELDPLVEGGVIHSQPDFVVAERQKEDIEDITDSMDEATNVNLEICEVFPKLPEEVQGETL